jgi:hypothetical protein
MPVQLPLQRWERRGDPDRSAGGQHPSWSTDLRWNPGTPGGRGWILGAGPARWPPVPAGSARPAGPAGGRRPLCRRRPVGQPGRPGGRARAGPPGTRRPSDDVFNGDFHWLDVDPDDFRSISATVLAHHATRGNVEAELAAEEETAGCGCAYPDYVGDEVVDRSNQIITRLRATAGQFPEVVGRLGELPRHLTASVGGGTGRDPPWGLRVAGRLAAGLEAMGPGDPDVRRQVGWRGRPTTTADLLDWFARAKVSVFASTHTGLPFAQVICDGRHDRLVINNGSGRPGQLRRHHLWRHHAAFGQPPTSRRQPVRHLHRQPALRRVGGAVRSRPVDGALPGPVGARQPWPPRLLRPHHRRDPPAAGAGRTRRYRAGPALIDGCRCSLASSYRHPSM